MNAPPAPDHAARDRLKRLACLPIPLFLALIAVLWVADLPTAYPAPYLQTALNFVTRTLASLLVVYLAGRSFLARGNPGLLLLGCGVAIWGTASTVTTAVVTRDANVGVTISNLGVWLSALCYLAGAVFSLRSERVTRAPGLWLGAGYALALGVIGFITLATFAGWLPVFFVQGEGGTLVRHIVLSSAIATFVLTAVLLWEGNRPSLSPFVYWYILALLLITAGLCGLMIEASRNSVLDWTCRAAQYLSGIYMLIAALASRRAPGLRGITLGHALREERYRYGVAIAIVFAATAVRLAFLPALGTRAIFLTFYPAVMLAALYGGLRAGLLATLLSALAADYFFIGPPGLAVGDAGDWLALAVFLASCTMVCGITEAMHRARVRAAAAEAETRFADERVRAAEALQQSEEFQSPGRRALRGSRDHREGADHGR